LPDELLEILRLTGGIIRPKIASFAPSALLPCPPGVGGVDGSVALSPDGRIAVCAFMQTEGKVWDLGARREIATLPATKSSATRALAFSPDGKELAVAGSEILILDARTGNILRRLEPWGGSLNGVSFTPDGELLLATADYQDQLFVYSVARWQRLAEVPNAPRGTRRYFQSVSGAWAVVGTRDGNIVLWDRAARRAHAALDTSRFPMFAAFSPDETRVAVVERLGGDCRERECETPIKVWDVRVGHLLYELRPFEVTLHERLEGLLWSPDGEHILAVARPSGFFTSRGVEVWSATTGRHRAELTGPPARVGGLALTPDGKTVVAASNDANVYVWDFGAALKAIAPSPLVEPR
jgi:WD40 repeat protein